MNLSTFFYIVAYFIYIFFFWVPNLSLFLLPYPYHHHLDWIYFQKNPKIIVKFLPHDIIPLYEFKIYSLNFWVDPKPGSYFCL